MLQIVYLSVVAAVCWGSSITARDTNNLNKLIKKAGGGEEAAY